MSDTSTPEISERLADDLIFGVDGERGIARELGLKPAAVYYLIRTNRLPHGRLGRNIFASKRALKRWFAGESKRA
jgi:hypothetical protein